MTIGADIPLRLKLEARVRDIAGRDDRSSDMKLAVENEFGSAFEAMVKTVSKRSSDADEKIDDKNTDAHADEPDLKDDKPAAFGQGGVFGQTILALEQLLERQHGAGDTLPAEEATDVLTKQTDVSGPLPEGEPAIPDADFEMKMVDDATTGGMAALDETVVAGPMPTPHSESEPAAPPSFPTAQPAVSTGSSADEAQTVEPQVDSKSGRTPAEATSAPGATTSANPQVQVHTKAIASAVQSAPQTYAPPPIKDVQIIADRSSGVTRTLVIQLQPVELGTVTARMRLTSEGMHIQLAAEDRVAAEHLARDHEALGKALKLAGVGDDASAVTIAVIDRSSPASNNHGLQSNIGGQEQQAGARANGQGSTSGGAAREGSQDQQFPGDGRADEREDKAGRQGIERSLSRGLVV